MHASSLENMQKCYNRYIIGGPLENRSPLKVLDIGGADVNGSYVDIFNADNVEYIGADLKQSKGVSILLEDPCKLPLEDNSIDVVISGQMLEHCERFWVTFSEMVRVLKNDGFLFLIAPSSGPVHRYPVDCYRFYPDSYKSLAKQSECHLVDCWLDTRGPWKDLVGVFSKKKMVPNRQSFIKGSNATLINKQPATERKVHEKIQGERPYLETIAKLHEIVRPKNYLEIGVRHGKSLILSNCNSVGVDPLPDLKVELPNTTRVVQQTSDDFFDVASDPILKEKLDFVFIDGMHLFEYALRDFMNVESYSSRDTIVVIDDIYPNNPLQASRVRETRVWTGDVWKLYHCLKKYRPDLVIIPLNTSPSGLLLILGLNSKNRVLWNRYNPIVREATGKWVEPGPDILNRKDALSPASKLFKDCLELIRLSKQSGKSFSSMIPDIRKRISHEAKPQPAQHVRRLALSVIVVAFNMARELPRTLKSLSETMQYRVSANDYEVIVVDNGSTQAFDEALCKMLCPNTRFIYEQNASVSPVSAINKGVVQANGELIGLMIDGARLASPGLLRSAMDASKTSEKAVIGTLSFHLGNAVQMQSVKSGYDQSVEDKLLDSVHWEEDGYRLFDISVFAGSSKKGWFSLPAETNALFMHKNMWIGLEGYDEKFQQPGGGLANLDIWNRACHLPDSEIIMLLGEATFHQFHGGIATNSEESKWKVFNQEYKAIRGHDYKPPKAQFTCFGKIRSNQKMAFLDSAYSSLTNDQLSYQTSIITQTERSFRSPAPSGLLSNVQHGVMKSKYRGIPFYKSPFDIGIYIQLLSKLKPKSLIEIGTKYGGSALWFADTMSTYNNKSPQIISVDIDNHVRFKDDRITFLEGDAAALHNVLKAELIDQLPRPILVIEDSSHLYKHSMACLRFFHNYLQEGDYIVVEDGILEQFPESQYRVYENGPNRAVADFLEEFKEYYVIDTDLCDHYGFNLTYNPNGYLQRIK